MELSALVSPVSHFRGAKGDNRYAQPAGSSCSSLALPWPTAVIAVGTARRICSSGKSWPGDHCRQRLLHERFQHLAGFFILYLEALESLCIRQEGRILLAVVLAHADKT